MIYLLDTNAVSEAMHRKPAATVKNWLNSIPPEHFAISALTVGELRKGAEKPGIDPARRQRLRHWLAADFPHWFNGRILPVDDAVADRWGRLLASMPRTLPSIDALIAATALHHNLKLVTRNVADFDDIPALELLNPWP